MLLRQWIRGLYDDTATATVVCVQIWHQQLVHMKNQIHIKSLVNESFHTAEFYQLLHDWK